MEDVNLLAAALVAGMAGIGAGIGFGLMGAVGRTRPPRDRR